MINPNYSKHAKELQYRKTREERRKHAQMMALAKNKKMTKKERILHSKMMNKIRREKIDSVK